MNKWLKENWFKLALLALGTFIILSWCWFNYINFKLQSCIQGGRYLVYSEESGTSLSNFIGGMKTVWWGGRWNFEKEECEKEEIKYQSIRETRIK